MTQLISARGVRTLLACFVWSAVALAQTVDGTILGTVSDQQKAGVVKAEVSARSTETGAIRRASTDEYGRFRISSVPAGVYEVTATAAGFKTAVENGAVVTVGADTALTFTLAIGEISEKVEVTGEGSQVDTSSSIGGGFVNSAVIRELPLNGRDWLQLAFLQPGVSFASGQDQTGARRGPRGNGLAISIAGGRPTDNAFRIDGLVVNDYANGGPGSALRVNLGVDAIREFSVLTDNYSAEYGRGSGGIVNAITKSGSNQLHGSAYYFIRNSALDARNFFDGTNIPPFRRSQFGGAAGGPIRKDKTFFFVNYEDLHELQSQSSSVFTLSANAHNGILCANTPCTQTTTVPIAPAIKPYLALFPVPNGAVSGNTGVFAYGAPMLGHEDYVIGKIDHYFTPSTTLTGGYSFDNSNSIISDNFNLLLAASPARRQNLVLSLVHLFSPSVIDNARVGFSRTHAGSNIDSDPQNPALADPSLGFLPGRNMGQIVISGVSGVYGGIGAGLGTNPTVIYGYTTPQFSNDLSWTKGRHSLRAGFSFERIDDNLNSPQNSNGRWSFASVQTFLQGVPSLFQADFPGTDTVRGARMSLVAGYIQDDFRIRSNLTLNLGVRYEMGTVVSEVNGKLANLRSLTDTAPAIGGSYYNNPTLKNFAPRLGFAWDPFSNGKTAVRGGFAMFDIVPLPYLFVQRIARSEPFFLAGQLNPPPASSFPNQGFQSLNPSNLTTVHIDTNPHRSYKAQWNFNIQRQLTRSLALTTGYVGSAGVHLAHIIDDADQVPASLVTFSSALDAYLFPIPAAGQAIQRINPNFGRIALTDWSGHSSYHALQANLLQRPLQGLTYQVAYTWSKSIDNGSTTLGDNESANSAGASWAFDPRINRGVSDFDIPHNFVANLLYDVPMPDSVKAHAVSKALLAGWQVGAIYTIQSGSPFTLKIGSDRSDTGNSQATTANGYERPMYVSAPGCSPNAVTRDINNYIKTQCFAWPAAGELGNLGRNTLRMPAFRDLDFSIFKNQNLWGEKLKAQFRAEMFNILNQTNLQAQVLTIFDGSGNLVSTVGQPHAPTVNTARQIQFGLRFLF